MVLLSRKNYTYEQTLIKKSIAVTGYTLLEAFLFIFLSAGQCKAFFYTHIKNICKSTPWHSSTSIYSSVLQRWSQIERLQPAGHRPYRPVLTASDHAPEPYPHLHAWYPPPGERFTEQKCNQLTRKYDYERVWQDGARSLKIGYDWKLTKFHF